MLEEFFAARVGDRNTPVRFYEKWDGSTVTPSRMERTPYFTVSPYGEYMTSTSTDTTQVPVRKQKGQRGGVGMTHQGSGVWGPPHGCLHLASSFSLHLTLASKSEPDSRAGWKQSRSR
jgi:hypothetical protein